MSNAFTHLYHIFRVTVKIRHGIVQRVVICIHILIDRNFRHSPFFKQRGHLLFKQRQIFKVLAAVADGFKAYSGQYHISVDNAVALFRIAEEEAVSRRANAVVARFGVVENIRLRINVPVHAAVFGLPVTDFTAFVHIGNPIKVTRKAPVFLHPMHKTGCHQIVLDMISRIR